MDVPLYGACGLGAVYNQVGSMVVGGLRYSIHVMEESVEPACLVHHHGPSVVVYSFNPLLGLYDTPYMFDEPGLDALLRLLVDHSGAHGKAHVGDHNVLAPFEGDHAEGRVYPGGRIGQEGYLRLLGS